MYALYALVSGVDWVAERALSPERFKAWQDLSAIPHWTWRTWALVGALLSLAVMFEGCVRLVRHLESTHEGSIAKLDARIRELSNQIADKPRAILRFTCDKTGWARLYVTNKGGGAMFTATIQTQGFTAGQVEGKPITWIINRANDMLWSGMVQTMLGEDDYVDVTIVADPDLVAPCKARIYLRHEGKCEMVRL
jgi:hypothetical protein